VREPRGLDCVSVKNSQCKVNGELTNDDREEPNDVKDKQQAFDQRKLLRQSSVEEDGESSDCDDKESSMPWSLSLQRILLVVE